MTRLLNKEMVGGRDEGERTKKRKMKEKEKEQERREKGERKEEESRKEGERKEVERNNYRTKFQTAVGWKKKERKG